MIFKLETRRVPVKPQWLAAKAALVAMLGVMLCTGQVSAEPAKLTEYQVKAAYLFNFARFAEWPTNRLGPPGEPLVIGVLGDDPFGAVLDKTVAGKTVNERPLVIRRLAPGDDLKQCHLLFISRSETARLAPLLAQLHTNAILTVSEAGSFLGAGGMIQFVSEEGTVKFEVNPGAAQDAGVQISARLLNVARAVKSAPAKLEGKP